MIKNFIAQEECRLDVFLAQQLDQTRNQVTKLIKKDLVQIDGKIVSKTGFKLKAEQNIEVQIPKPEEQGEIHEDINFDVEVVYEDEHLLVVNKPSGVVVHPAPSVKEATLVDWLKSKNFKLSNISGEVRNGIVHRLDKGTSGLLVVAKTNEAHLKLSQQLEDKSMGRYYVAITDNPLKEDVTINKQIGRSRNNRLKMGVVEDGRDAKTSFIKLDVSKTLYNTRAKYELICAKLFTGRTHQIRVHLESINRHIIGDSLYGFLDPKEKYKRVYLHAYCLYFKHPVTNEYKTLISPMPSEMMNILENNFNMDYINELFDTNIFLDRFSTS